MFVILLLLLSSSILFVVWGLFFPFWSSSHERALLAVDLTVLYHQYFKVVYNEYISQRDNVGILDSLFTTSSIIWDKINIYSDTAT